MHPCINLFILVGCVFPAFVIRVWRGGGVEVVQPWGYDPGQGRVRWEGTSTPPDRITHITFAQFRLSAVIMRDGSPTGG